MGRAWRWVLLTPPVVLLAHCLAVLPHEFAHRFMAWALGVPVDPLAIDWGGTSLANVLLLIHVDEGLDYPALLAEGPGWRVALIAFAGPGIANGGLMLWARLRIGRTRPPARRPLAAYLLYWFFVMNLANLYDYVPMRVFGTGDVQHFLAGTGWSPWWVWTLGGYGVAALIADLYLRVLPRAYLSEPCRAPGARAALMVLTTLILLGYFALPGVLAGEEIPRFVGINSLIVIPAVIWFCWPSRAWAAGRMARIEAAASQQIA